MANDRQRLVVMVGPSLSSRGGIASVCAEYERNGLFQRLRVVYIPSFVSASAGKKLATAVVGLTRFFWLLALGRVGLLHVHMATGASTWRKIAFCLLAQVFALPYVVHLHSGKFPDYYSEKLRPWQRQLVKRVLSRSAKLVVLTSERVRWLLEQGFLAEKILVLPNMVSMAEQVGGAASASGHKMLFLGRLEEAKGVSDLLRAFALHLHEMPESRLVLGGEGDFARYQSLAFELQVDANVQFVGWIEGQRKTELIERSLVFVLPSYFEGLPMGILEAMSYGVPCVATPVGGIPDIISDKENGLLVPCGDVVALARALTDIAKDEKLRCRLSEAARATIVHRYSVKHVEELLRKLYREFTV